MANQPRAYREVIAEAVRDLRPEVEVKIVEPDSLESEISAFVPDLVICDEAGEAVREHVKVWVELYPNFSPLSVTSVGGRVSTIEGIQLADILDIIDRTEELIRQN